MLVKKVVDEKINVDLVAISITHNIVM